MNAHHTDMCMYLAGHKESLAGDIVDDVRKALEINSAWLRGPSDIKDVMVTVYAKLSEGSQRTALELACAQNGVKAKFQSQVISQIETVWGASRGSALKTLLRISDDNYTLATQIYTVPRENARSGTSTSTS